MSGSVLVRYGMISEVARFATEPGVALERGERVVIRTHRGIEMGTLLEDVRAIDFNGARDPLQHSVNGGATATAEPADDAEATSLRILRTPTAEDERTSGGLKDECEKAFSIWRERIDDWKLRLELIDLEWTLDKSKLILYVLNDRGPECTKLALQAAAAGLGTVEVQPVGPEGLISESQGGGCGSGHCGSGGNSNGCCG
jgi:cell fate regulator YaaT (PSP1 superfamily)